MSLMASHTPSAIPGARFMDPVVLARIGNLSLVSRAVVDGFINGLHKAPYFGASVDFAEHRGYVPGDDIRRVDWKVFARTDRYYIKEFEADSNSNFTVLLDISKSMAFGAKITKLDYGKTVAACLTYLVHKQRDRVGLVTFDDLLRSLMSELFAQPQAAARDVASEVVELDGSAPATRLAELFGATIDSRDVRTVAGLLAQHLGRIPGTGERFLLGGLEFDVLQASVTRVERLAVRRGPVRTVSLDGGGEA